MPPDLEAHAKLPARWQEHFPRTIEQASYWEPYIQRRALHRCCLVVAVTRIEIGWKAYCGNVAGLNHENEWEEVTRTGVDVGEKIARAMFPEFDGVRYAR